jgi:folate-binding protein YgfZ
VKVVGPEREIWLQGMQSNDLALAPVSGAIEAAFLNGRGRLVSTGIIWRYPDHLVITSDAPLREHLDKLLIMEDAELVDAPGLHRLRFWNSAPLDLEGYVSPLGFEVLLPSPDVAGPRAEGVDAYRAAIGLPKWGVDIDEETTPVEAGLDRMISFGKGCYVGQEVVAMATFRGRVAWNFVRLEVDGAPPALSDKITSAVQVGPKSILLGYVRKEAIVPGSTVQLDDGRTATVLGLPYGSLPGGGVCA